MNFIIFGSSGFIGTHLTEYIESKKSKDCAIYKYDINKVVSSDFETLDVRTPINLNIPNSSSSIIYNLAAVHTTPGHSDHEYFETNILGAEHICNFARENHIYTIVFTSSIAPYGVSEEIKNENSIPMPNTPYGISKLTAEYIHKIWQAEDALRRRLIILRPGVVFGKHEGGNFTRLYISMKKGFFFYPGRKDTVKSCIYVKDVVRIIYQSSINESSGVLLLNLSYYPAPTINDICDTIAAVTNVRRPKIVLSALFLNSAATIAYNIGHLIGKKLYGVHPDRLKKLMISTNIGGEKLNQSPYKIEHTLEQAIVDWYVDCDKKALF